MPKRLKLFIRDRDGATAIEYGLLAALIAVAALTAFETFGTGLSNMWGHVRSESINAMG